jgi:hypothetical protein
LLKISTTLCCERIYESNRVQPFQNQALLLPSCPPRTSSELENEKLVRQISLIYPPKQPAKTQVGALFADRIDEKALWRRAAEQSVIEGCPASCPRD